MLHQTEPLQSISGMPLGTIANSMRAENWGELTDAVVPMYTDEESVAPQTSLGNILLLRPSPRWRT